MGGLRRSAASTYHALIKYNVEFLHDILLHICIHFKNEICSLFGSFSCETNKQTQKSHKDFLFPLAIYIYEHSLPPYFCIIHGLQFLIFIISQRDIIADNRETILLREAPTTLS